jgi:hypothetical protein
MKAGFRDVNQMQGKSLVVCCLVVSGEGQPCSGEKASSSLLVHTRGATSKHCRLEWAVCCREPFKGGYSLGIYEQDLL